MFFIVKLINDKNSRALWNRTKGVHLFFLKLEKQRQICNRIDNLKDHSGRMVQDDTDILNECLKFYGKLYSTNNPDRENITSYLHEVTLPNTLTEEDQALCEGAVTKEECECVINKLKLNKSPGLDGIGAEFYIQFASSIIPILIKAFNESYDDGQLSTTQNQSI